MAMVEDIRISIHKALAGLDDMYQDVIFELNISIHKALAGLDDASGIIHGVPSYHFNPQGPRGPRQGTVWIAVRAYDISIHKALAGLDRMQIWVWMGHLDFNPQGPRGPRRL